MVRICKRTTRCNIERLKNANWNLIVEADGNYWHNIPGRKEKDLIRDKKLKTMGYEVVRFWEADIHKKIRYIKEQIKEILG